MSQNQKCNFTDAEYFLIENRKYGTICRNKELFEKLVNLTSFLPIDIKAAPRCWHILNNQLTPVICKMCDRPTRWDNDNKIFRIYCSVSCMQIDPETRIKRENTNLKRFGFKNPNSNPEQHLKIQKTMMDKYGVNTFLKTKKCKIANIKYIKENIDDINKKREQTILDIYGSKQKYHADRYETMKATNLDKYGVKHTSQLPENRKRAMATTIERYGVEYAVQNPIVFEKQVASGHKTKKYTFPSGKVVDVQGFEDQALDILLQTYQESEILTNRADMPEIWYVFEGNRKRYHPDIFIPHENKIIEVKSTWTANQAIERNEAKKNACISLGYLFEFMVI